MRRTHDTNPHKHEKVVKHATKGSAIKMALGAAAGASPKVAKCPNTNLVKIEWMSMRCTESATA